MIESSRFRSVSCRLVVASLVVCVGAAVAEGTQQPTATPTPSPSSAGTPASDAVAQPTTSQTPPTTPAPTTPAVSTSAEGPFERLGLTAGRSRVLTVDFNIGRIAVTNPAIADAVVVSPREVLIDGKGPGTTSLIVWGEGRRAQYDVAVDPGVTTLEQQFEQVFPGEDIKVTVSDDAVILQGKVSNTSVMLRAGEIATAAYGKNKVINLLQVPGAASQQVMLQVRFAEVNRRALLEVGATYLIARGNWTGRVTTQQFAAPDFEADDLGNRLVFSDFLNIFAFYHKEGLGAVIKALQQRGFFQSLAEPNLVAYNGQEASFLAGGEFPVPVVQGATGTVTIEWKEFGVRLSFRPTIAGDTIRLHVKPEVSTLDFNNGLTLEGFRVPALSTRRAETDVELRDGQSFVIAGLLNNVSQTDSAAIPILSALPIIGHLFKSKAERAERTELMVLITPRLVKPLDPDEVPPLPTTVKPFLPPVTGESGDAPGPADAPPLDAARRDQ